MSDNPQIRPAVLSAAVAVFLLGPRLTAVESKMGYWDTARCGANFFNSVEQKERFVAARATGVEFVRLAPNKWLNGRPESARGDFLLGRPGRFVRVDADDLGLLRRVLDDAHAAGLKVVLTMLSLPGSRWRQHNGGKQEFTLWQDFESQEQAIECWRQLAAALKGHPAVVGYNLLNEPCPERAGPVRLADWFTGDYVSWQERVAGTAADLSLFYEKAVRAIREVDDETPVVLDCGFYATPWAFPVLHPVTDTKTLYSFHFYEPFAFTSRANRGRHVYPGRIPTGEGEAPPEESWDRARMVSFLKPVSDWQQRWQIPALRILVGELGVYRTNAGAARYLDDALDVLTGQGWHWAFYAFREDNWDGMDYELGVGRPGAAYWQAIEAGRMPGEEVYRGSPLFDVIQKRLTQKSSDASKQGRPSAQRVDSFVGVRAGDEIEVGGIRLCWCPPGRFQMGSPFSELGRRADEAQVEVTLSKGFWTGKFEVTQHQWKREMGAIPGELIAGEGDEFPVYWVSFVEAEEYCRRLTQRARALGELPMSWEFRLPTEAQWEYACRAGTTTAFSFGESLTTAEANIGKPYNGKPDGTPGAAAVKVGNYKPNAWGLHDMHGNEFEWCRDWYHPRLPGGLNPDLGDVQGTPNRDGTYSRVRRGGAWMDDPPFCRSALRLRFEPPRSSDHIGFRIVAVEAGAARE